MDPCNWPFLRVTSVEQLPCEELYYNYGLSEDFVRDEHPEFPKELMESMKDGEMKLVDGKVFRRLNAYVVEVGPDLTAIVKEKWLSFLPAIEQLKKLIGVTVTPQEIPFLISVHRDFTVPHMFVDSGNPIDSNKVIAKLCITDEGRDIGRFGPTQVSIARMAYVTLEKRFQTVKMID